MTALAVPAVPQQTATSREEQNKALIRKCLQRPKEAPTAEARVQNSCFADQVTFQGRTVSRDSLLANLDDIRTTFPDLIFPAPPQRALTPFHGTSTVREPLSADSHHQVAPGHMGSSSQMGSEHA